VPGPIEPAAYRRIAGNRLEAVRSAVREQGGAGALLWTRRNFAWLTIGGANHVVQASERGVAPILVTPDRAIVLAPINERDRLAEEELGSLPIDIESIAWSSPDGIATRATEIGGGRLLDDAELEATLLPRRSVLDTAEQVRMAWLGRRVRKHLDAAAADLAPGGSEDEVAAALTSSLAIDGIRAPVLLAAADERIERYRHPLPTSKVAQRRMMIVAVAERWGLHVAATTFAELQPRSEDLERRFEAVTEILEAMRTATRSGRTLGDVLAAARETYRLVGFPDEWLLHHQGGTIGYQSRERVAVPDDPAPIEAGMAFAWNPSITGAKLEETLLLDDAGPVSVTEPSTT
jgi:Xaa-Pro aminopeptidase